MLFEVLQDVTGGIIVFSLATKSFIADITTPEERTSRMVILDAFNSLGSFVGTPVGTRILKYFGYVTLFSVTLGLVVVAILYTVVFLRLKKPADMERQTSVKLAFEEEKEKAALKCDKGNSFVTRIRKYISI